MPKHYAAYGAATGGRDYNSVDMSERMLREVHLPPFKAAAMAGAATFMNSFNDLNGVPASGSAFLMRNILKGEWNFNGFVVSDWASIREMIPHGFAENDRDAAKLALNAGSDMDMEGYCYRDNLKDLVEKGEVSLSNLDDAVRRVLRKKFEMGLFEDPFRFTDPVREEKAMNNPEHRKAARDMARKSIVLLKNDDELLPLKNGQKIALIGPLAKSEDDMLGGWAVGWDDNSDVVSQFEGFEIRFGKQNLLYSKGCGVSDPSKDGFKDAIKTAKAADVVVLSIGESRSMNGEAASRSNLGLPECRKISLKRLWLRGNLWLFSLMQADLWSLIGLRTMSQLSFTHGGWAVKQETQ